MAGTQHAAGRIEDESPSGLSQAAPYGRFRTKKVVGSDPMPLPGPLLGSSQDFADAANTVAAPVASRAEMLPDWSSVRSPRGHARLKPSSRMGMSRRQAVEALVQSAAR